MTASKSQIFLKVDRLIPQNSLLFRALRFLYRESKETVKILKLILASRKPFQSHPDTNVIVSLTSFPARIKYAWIPIETMFLQDTLFWKVVLVLSEEEFPDKLLPYRIRQQEKRGLEILWTKSNIGSYKKLLPTRTSYPDATIVTIDDDVYYSPWMLRQLISAARNRPGTIIGFRGWAITLNNKLLPYIEWPEANPITPTDNVFLTGAGGILYPPHLVSDNLLLNYELAKKLCPTADDIWFWAIARKAGIPLFCIGNHDIERVRRQRKSPALESINRERGQNDIQLKAIIEFFDLL